MNQDDELEAEILSYREFRNRETLLAWERRRRALEAQAARRRDTSRRDGELMVPPLGSRAGAPPLRSGR